MMGIRFGLAFTLLVFAASSAPGARLPVYFLRSTGHHTGDFDFALQNASVAAEFRDREVSYSLGPRTVRVHYCATRSTHPEGLEEGIGSNTFLSGSGGGEAAAGYRSLAYRELWPGIDAVYSTNSGHLKMEFQIAPSADSGLVHWDVEGADHINISRSGALVIDAGGEQLREEPPQVFEQDRFTGELRHVVGAFRLIHEHSVGISVGEYDHANRLIFDPVIEYNPAISAAAVTSWVH